MDPNALYSALNTIAQCSAALAALIGFLGLWRLDRLREDADDLEEKVRQHPVINTPSMENRNRLSVRWTCMRNQQHQLLGVLRIFLVVTLIILGAAVVGFLYVDQAKAWGWTPWLLWIAGGWMAVGPIIVVFTAARLPRAPVDLVLLLGLISSALASPALAGSVRCTSTYSPTLYRYDTLCSDGTRAVSPWSPTLRRCEITVTPMPPKERQRKTRR